MSFQQIMFQEYLDPIKLKEGKANCPCCNRPMKAYGYNLDSKLVDLAFKILHYCSSYQTTTFKPLDVFLNDVRANTQFQKLKLFGITERTKHAGFWRLKQSGYKFLKGDKALPKKVWVFRDKVILVDDKFQIVSEVEARWKEYYSDWTQDYILQPYETTVNLFSK